MAWISGFKSDIIQAHKGDQPWPWTSSSTSRDYCMCAHLVSCVPWQGGAHCLLCTWSCAEEELLTLWRLGPRIQAVQEAGVGTVLISRHLEQDPEGMRLAHWMPDPVGCRLAPISSLPSSSQHAGFSFSFCIFWKTIWQVVEWSWWQAAIKISLSS